MWSSKTGSLSLQWSFKTGYCNDRLSIFVYFKSIKSCLITSVLLDMLDQLCKILLLSCLRCPYFKHYQQNTSTVQCCFHLVFQRFSFLTTFVKLLQDLLMEDLTQIIQIHVHVQMQAHVITYKVCIFILMTAVSLLHQYHEYTCRFSFLWSLIPWPDSCPDSTFYSRAQEVLLCRIPIYLLSPINMTLCLLCCKLQCSTQHDRHCLNVYNTTMTTGNHLLVLSRLHMNYNANMYGTISYCHNTEV